MTCLSYLKYLITTSASLAADKPSFPKIATPISLSFIIDLSLDPSPIANTV